MGSSRWIVVVLLMAVGSAVGLHRGLRERLRDMLADTRLVLTGSPADRFYLHAERQFQAGDFEKSEITCARALAWNRSHIPARALMMEVQFLLGRGTLPSQDNSMGQQPAGRQTLIEIDNALARADRWMQSGDGEKAGAELRKVLEYAKWLPVGVETNLRMAQARSGIDLIEAEFHFPP